jgi:hypothetical protein
MFLVTTALLLLLLLCAQVPCYTMHKDLTVPAPVSEGEETTRHAYRGKS